jgi:hypothetical protein
MNDGSISLSQLEAHLWESANILRGPVDAADFKTYVFPLLFFKRISDVYDEEYAAALEESGGDEEYAQFPQNYRFQMSKGCHWKDVRVITTNVGQALQTAMRGIEKANPETLYGIFGDAAWPNKERLPDALLRDLIEHFSRISLGNQTGQMDILGQSYEYLIKKFADLTNKKAGEFYTPRSIVRLMVKILEDRAARQALALTLKKNGLAEWKIETAEKLLRIVHTTAFFTALLARPGQKLFWMSDDDEICSNEQQHTLVLKLYGQVLGLYAEHTNSFRLIGGATPFTERHLDTLDLLSLSDIVSSSVEHYLTKKHKNDSSLVKGGAHHVLQWLAHDGIGLKKMTSIIRKTDAGHVRGANLEFSLQQPTHNFTNIPVVV